MTNTTPGTLTRRQPDPAELHSPNVNAATHRGVDKRSTAIAKPHFESTRKSRRIRYDDWRVCRRRADDKKRERERAAAGTWVIGRFLITGDIVTFEAIEMQIGYYISRNAPLTTAVARFYRWNTRQAAHQYLRRNPDPCLHPVNLEQLKGRMALGE